MSFRQRGFTLIEVLITAFVLGVVTVAVTGLALVLTRTSLESERQEVAINIATEKVENLRAAYEARGFEVVDFEDISPQGFVKRQETITRNNLEYTITGHIHEIDDPANGTGTPDFKTVLYKVAWTSNIGQIPGSGAIEIAASALSFSPESVLAASQPSAVVAAVALYTEAVKADDSCVPGTDTCPNPECTPGATCANGQICLPSGLCPGSSHDLTTICPASGKCSDSTPDTQPPAPPGPEQCPGGINSVGQTGEACDLSVCNDGLDNEGDGFVDGADPQCQEGARNAALGRGNAIYTPLSECIINEATCPVDPRGIQLLGRLGTVVTYGQCTAYGSCGIVAKEWHPCLTECNDAIDNDGDGFIDGLDAACGVSPNHRSETDPALECANGRDDDGAQGIDLTDPSCSGANDDDEFCPFGEQNQCQEIHDCPQGSRCIPPQPNSGQCTGENCCPDAKAICGNGFCWECLANQPVDNVACDLATKADPERGEGWCGVRTKAGSCVCKPGQNKCVQCSESDGAVGANCANNTPYCSSGSCVECTTDDHCAVIDPNKPFCRTVLQPKQFRNTCVAACDNGRDDDGDGFVDWSGYDANGDGDTDDPGDKQRDVGCANNTDNDEEGEPTTSPGPQTQCSNGFDDFDAEDSLADANDPGCHLDGNAGNPGSYDPFDDDETNAVGTPPTVTQCNDGLDNDGDGTWDYLSLRSDTDCTSWEDDSEAAPGTPQPTI